MANGTHLSVDSSDNRKVAPVAPDSYTPSSGDVGQILTLSTATGWAAGDYIISAVSSGKWVLDRSPAATSTTGGVWALKAVAITALGSPQGATFNLGEWQDTRLFKVYGPQSDYAAIQALTYGGYGYQGAHPTIPIIVGAEVRIVERATDSNNFTYVIATTYRRIDNPPSPLQPMLRPALVAVRFDLIQEPTDVDRTGHPVCDSAGIPFDPPTTRDLVEVRITALKWASSYNLSTALGYVGAVNSSAVTILGLPAPARCLKCLNFAPLEKFYVGQGPLAIVYEFAYRAQASALPTVGSFDKRIIDKSFNAWYEHYVSGGSPTVQRGKITIKSNPAQPVSQPVMLDGQGEPLPSLMDGYAVDDPAFKRFRVASPTQLPAYMTPIQLPDGHGGTDGAYLLPYRICEEADFSYFSSTVGL